MEPRVHQSDAVRMSRAAAHGLQPLGATPAGRTPEHAIDGAGRPGLSSVHRLQRGLGGAAGGAPLPRDSGTCRKHAPVAEASGCICGGSAAGRPSQLFGVSGWRPVVSVGAARPGVRSITGAGDEAA